MKKNKQREKNIHRRVIIYIVVIVSVAMILEMAILNVLHHKNAEKTIGVLVRQVADILLENEQTKNELTAELKDEYKLRAKTVSYILDANPEAEGNIAELENIAQMMEIDEIHLFDENGYLYGGTVPSYYGIDFSSGEQISYFKPMLGTKALSMCQDVTPNTAEKKSMMYAITWNASGTKMVQVGVEPKRLLEKLDEMEVSRVIDNMPAYEGIQIYVVSMSNRKICGATDESTIGKSLTEIGLIEDTVDLGYTISDELTYENRQEITKIKRAGDYVVAIEYSLGENVESSITALYIELIYLVLASLVIYLMVNKVLAATNEKQEQLSILTSLSDIYYSMHLIDIRNNSIQMYSDRYEVREMVDDKMGADELMVCLMTAVTTREYLERVLAFTDITTLPERIQGRKIISGEFVGSKLGWFEASFIVIEADEEESPTKVMFVTRSIDDVKKKEAVLIRKSNTDELTGLYNRRAYVESLQSLEEDALPENLVYVSMDVNGLKVVNDNLGHAAGDELIVGACTCMKKCMGTYGRLYRTGGDEFVALLYVNGEELSSIQKDFEQTCMAWSGELVDSLAVSCGYVTVPEAPSLKEIALLADKRMYTAKSQFYRKKGVDRRGQQEAYTALCALYTKILKINLTEDSFQILRMDEAEQTKEKGYDDKISGWLYGFGVSGQVHPDDLQEYLALTKLENMRTYFEKSKTALTVFYRRKYGDTYKRVMMELIPAGDYTDENQSLFLYVKDIDC